MKTIRIHSFILPLFLFLSFGIKAKDFERKFERAEGLYRGGNYAEALQVYLDCYKADTSNANICYKVGLCYLKSSNQAKQAVKFLKKATRVISPAYEAGSKKEKGAPVMAYRYLGDAYHLNSQFEEAIQSYETFKKSVTPQQHVSRELMKEVEKMIRHCNNARELVAHPADVKILNLGKNINSAYPDYCPRLSADQCTMIFTSKRPENTGNKTYDGGQYFEDIYIATRKDKNSPWTRAANIGWPINTVGNEAAIGISADGQEMLIYKDDLGDGNIYSSRLDGDSWTTPAKLNNNINSKFWEPAAFLSADGTTLYFVSDRPGGYGGTDIYKSKRTPGGDWGRAVNLGPKINTAEDEYSPFIHPDGITLYFSSKGHKNIGGYDVFYSRIIGNNDKNWEEPVNVGYPINTPGDDAFYMVSPDKQRAYYSSFRDGGEGEKDNYMITFNEAMEPAPALSLIKGSVLDSNRRAPRNVVITVMDNTTGEVIGSYKPNIKSGKYAVVLNPGNHTISYEADSAVFYSERRFVSAEKPYNEIDNNVKLPQMAVGSKVTLNNIFFDFDQARLRPNSTAELERLYNYLKKYPSMKVEIAGYADAKGSDDYNKKLSFERAQSVVNYLNTKGIEKNRLTAVGYGESYRGEKKPNAVAKGSSLEDSMQLDRRVELKILAIK
jgi:outer membrane protein OmpA-like peptidoglycan-associated protein